MTADVLPENRAVARGGGRRALLLMLAGFSLLAGLDAALLLLGLPAPIRSGRLPEVHGVVLVLGFVGTLIAMERAVALGRRTGYAAPLLLGLSALTLAVGLPVSVGRAGLVLGCLALVLLYLPLWRRQHDRAVLVQALGAVLALAAAVLLLGGLPVPTVVPWLACFLILTIAGERLELARLEMAPATGAHLVALALGLTAAVTATLLWPDPGHPLLGASLLVLVGALLRHARRMIAATGAPRFMAACLLLGYAWLLVAGAVWMLGPAVDGAAYDAVVHAVFLGFTLSMIMAHATVILPAVLRRPLPYRPAMWAPVVLLHLGLVLRLWVGDGLGVPAAWQVGGALNVAAVLLFVAMALWSACSAARSRR